MASLLSIGEPFDVRHAVAEVFARRGCGEVCSTAALLELHNLWMGKPSLEVRLVWQREDLGVEQVPDAGSYAPVTILIDERPSGVNPSYHRTASFIGPYRDAEALKVAQDLDSKVEALLIQMKNFDRIYRLAECGDL